MLIDILQRDLAGFLSVNAQYLPIAVRKYSLYLETAVPVIKAFDISLDARWSPRGFVT